MESFKDRKIQLLEEEAKNLAERNTELYCKLQKHLILAYMTKSLLDFISMCDSDLRAVSKVFNRGDCSTLTGKREDKSRNLGYLHGSLSYFVSRAKDALDDCSE